MRKGKSPSKKGKVSFTKYFQTFKEGESVAVKPDKSFNFGYSYRIIGRTGKVIEKRGNAYYVEVKEMNKPKRYLIKPIHLIRIQDKK